MDKKLPYVESENGVTIIRNAPLPNGKPIREMTAKQKTFADTFMKSGSLERAFIEGYAKNKTVKDLTLQERKRAKKILANKKIKEYIASTQEIDALKEQINVLDIRQIRGFWSNIMLDNNASLRDKLKASELLARSQGMFLDRVEHNMKVEVVFDGEKDDWDDIVDADFTEMN